MGNIIEVPLEIINKIYLHFLYSREYSKLQSCFVKNLLGQLESEFTNVRAKALKSLSLVIEDNHSKRQTHFIFN